MKEIRINYTVVVLYLGDRFLHSINSPPVFDHSSFLERNQRDSYTHASLNTTVPVSPIDRGEVDLGADKVVAVVKDSNGSLGFVSVFCLLYHSSYSLCTNRYVFQYHSVYVLAQHKERPAKKTCLVVVGWLVGVVGELSLNFYPIHCD